MKNTLVLALILASVTSFATTTKITCGSAGNEGQTEATAHFSGRVLVVNEGSEAVSGQAMLATQKGAAGESDLITMVGMSGVQNQIEEDNAGNLNVTSISLSSQASDRKAYLVINLGEAGSNARLTVDGVEIYSARCESEK